MNSIPHSGKWNEISSILNDNFSIIGLQLLQMSDASVYNKGVHESLDALTVAYPTPMVGSFAYVGTTTPYTIYTYTANGWGDSGVQGVPTETNFSEITIATEEKPGLMSTNQVKTLKELEQTTAELGQATAEISKKVIESVDVSELDSLVTNPTPANGKADYWLTKMYGDISIIIGRVFLFEDNMLHKVTQVVMSNQKLDENYPDGSHAKEGLTVYYRFYGHNTVDVPLKQWTPWKKLYDSEDMSPDEIETAISELQLKDKEHDDELQVIGNRVTTEINSIRSSTPVFANIVAGDVDLELSGVTSNYTVVYLENKKVFAALKAGKYWADWRAWGKYPSADSYGPAPAVGKVYIMGNALYVWNGSSLQEIGDFDDIKNNAQAIALLTEKLGTKAPKEGYAPDLKVDFAKELVGRGVAEPQEIGIIRPTGVISIGDGNATIEKVKGKSVVWNQVSNNSRCTPQFNTTSYTITKVGNVFNVSRAELASDAVLYDNLFLHTSIKFDTRNKYLFVGNYSVKKFNEFALYDGVEYFDSIFMAQDFIIFSPSKNATTTMIKLIHNKLVSVAAESYTLCPVVYNLTQMFGVGNEPTTIEEFEARKPLNIDEYAYNEGEIISYDAQELKSVGFNAYNGTYAKVIGGQQYHALGNITSIGFTTELGGETTAITLGSDGMFTPTEDGYVYAEGTDIRIHLTHTYTPEHKTEHEEDTLTLPDVKAIKDKDGNQLFPYGLLSAGSAHDEITATKAVKRIGVVDLGSLNWRYNSVNFRFVAPYSAFKVIPTNQTPNSLSSELVGYSGINFDSAKDVTKIYRFDNSVAQIYVRHLSYTDATTFKQAMQGVLLYYELATPIEVDLPEPLNLTYEAWDFGTEELIAEGATTPLNADIVYQFNAVDRIRENTTNVSEIEEEVATKQQELTLTVLDNGNIRIGNLQGQTKDFMPATPSGDPMHNIYTSLGAIWNGGADTTRTGAFGESIVHKSGCWYLNDLGDLTNDDMREVYAQTYAGRRKFILTSSYAGATCRTNIPIWNRSFEVYGNAKAPKSYLSGIAEDSNVIETICIHTTAIHKNSHIVEYQLYETAAFAFENCKKLKKIIGYINLQGLSSTTKMFYECQLLEEVNVMNVQTSISIEQSKNLSNRSILFMIDNSSATSAITITLHADAYARAMADASIQTSLTAHPNVLLASA